MQIPEKWTRDKLGIPEAQDGEVVLKAVQSDFNPDLKTPGKSTALSAHVVGCQCAGCLGKGAHVALSAGNNGETEQDLLDNSLNEALNVIDFNRQLDPVVRQLAVALTACNTYEEASDKLAEIYPDLNNAEHQRYLTQAVFLSELLGVSNAKR